MRAATTLGPLSLRDTLIKQAYRMTKGELVAAIEAQAAAKGQRYIYGGPRWMTKDELVNRWIDDGGAL